jgi:excisionase family DNA binding protein
MGWRLLVGVTSRPVPAGCFLDGAACVLLARVLAPAVRAMSADVLDELRPALAAIGAAAETERAAAAVRLRSDRSLTDGWVTTDEAATVLGCTPRAVVKAIAAGRLPAQRQGRRWRVDATALAG